MLKKIFSTLAALLVTSLVTAEVITTEYFFDEDPGMGKGYKAGTTSNGVITFKANLRGLKNGFHTLYVRGRNYDGWSHCVAIPVTIFDKSTSIVGSEYYFDTDPGEGKGVYVESSNETSVFVSVLDFDISKLKTGYHILYTRTKSDEGNWTKPIGTPYLYLPLIGSSSKAEFYVDKDPGEGNGKVATVKGSNVAFQLRTDNITTGNHTLYVRSQDENGIWSVDYGIPFVYDPIKEKVTWKDEFSIKPNPTKFNFDLVFTEIVAKDSSSANISIVTQSGKALYEARHNTRDKKVYFNVKDYAPGQYQVIVQKGNVVSVRKLVIKR